MARSSRRMSRPDREEVVPQGRKALPDYAAGIRADLSLAFIDLILVASGYLGALVLRFDGVVPQFWWHAFLRFVPVAVVVHFVANWVSGLYGKIWRHAGIEEARRLLMSGAISSITLLLGYVLLERRMPASVVLVGALVATFLIGGLRFQSRLFAFQRRRDHSESTAVIVIGAGEAGAAIIRDMLSAQSARLRPIAVLDDDTRKHGRSISGVPIAGSIADLPEVADRLDADQAILAIPSADSETVRSVVRVADTAGLTLRVLPSVAELLGGRPSVHDVRDVSITDLLGRQQVSTDLAAVRRMLHGRRVLVTGAGGSIGSELARQIAACGPAALVLLDHDETHLHDAAGRISHDTIQCLGDIRNAADVDEAFGRYRPEFVFHAAAHKHVPVLEHHPIAAAETNVIGTENVVRASRATGVIGLVFISTDKAVRPSSVMGASKRVGELLVTSLAPEGSRWCAVRFGNVLGSRGSVIPTFVRQIRQGGPVTVTDPAMTRFFMSIEEAVQLVLQAAALSSGGEVFMLDMGEPVSILELAERMIRLSGQVVGGDVEVTFTGIRPGEKLEEELQGPEERSFPTSHPSIVALFPTTSDADQLDLALHELRQHVVDRQPKRVVEVLETLCGTGRTLGRSVRDLP